MPDTPTRNGGARPGAGRKPLYGEPTVAFSIRIPASWADAMRDPERMKALRRAIARLIKK